MSSYFLRLIFLFIYLLQLLCHHIHQCDVVMRSIFIKSFEITRLVYTQKKLPSFKKKKPKRHENSSLLSFYLFFFTVESPFLFFTSSSSSSPCSILSIVLKLTKLLTRMSYTSTRKVLWVERSNIYLFKNLFEDQWDVNWVKYDSFCFFFTKFIWFF